MVSHNHVTFADIANVSRRLEDLLLWSDFWIHLLCGCCGNTDIEWSILDT